MGYKTKQGIYNPINPEKWIITESFDMKEPSIKYRSSWEKKFFIFMDINNKIVKANSEGLIIPYIHPITGKKAKYYMDAMFETDDGRIFVVEIKPKDQCRLPSPPRVNARNPAKAQQTYIKAMETFVINTAKWEAAKKLCDEKGWVFKIITEDELGL